MNNPGKILAAVVGIIAIGAAGAYMAGVIGGGQNNQGAMDSGIDVSATPCDGIGAARTAVMNEYNSGIEAADSKYSTDMEAASDAYWEKYRELETAKWNCESDALLADPCKDLFERASALAKEILDNIDSGYDEAKSAERDQVKEDYDDCVKNPPKEDTYEGKKAKCEADFSAGVAAAQTAREQAETQAAAARDQAKAKAESQKASKLATLQAIEEACNIPPPKTAVTAGGVTTGGTGTVVESGNPACTGKFRGYDPEIQAEINRLRALYDQARLKERQGGIGGASTYAAKMSELTSEMAIGPRKCIVDSDCGDTTKVCCSEIQVGWVVCSGGECSTEKEDCEDEEICTGKPAACVAPDTGLTSAAITISRVYIIGTPCNNKIQILDLKPKDENSARYEIVGNVPDWLGFSAVGGSLPQPVDVTADCNQLQTPGTYTAGVKVLIRDQAGNLINTIPVNVSIEAIQSLVEEDESAIRMGDDIDLDTGGDDAATAGGDTEINVSPQTEMAFAHVKPGEYSEVYLTVITGSGMDAAATLTGPGVVGVSSQTITADSNGRASFVWRINSYGAYAVSGNAGGSAFEDEVTVN